MSTFVKVHIMSSKKFAVTKELSMTKIKKNYYSHQKIIYCVFHAWVSYGHINSVSVTIIKSIIIQSKFFFLFIGWEPTTWPANNCLQIMVCSCAMPSNSVWLQIIFCSCVKETVLFSFLRSLLCKNGRPLRFPRIFIKKTNSVIEW